MRNRNVPDGDLNVALILLRVIRGWTQEDLGRASGIPSSSISDYERGKKAPGLKTLDRLTSAMDHSIISLERTRGFIQVVRAGKLLDDLRGAGGVGELVNLEAAVDAAVGSVSPAALQWELEEISADAGRSLTRLARALLVLLSRLNQSIQDDAGHGTARQD